MSAGPSPSWSERPPERLEQRIVIERDGTVVARSGKVEYGQGIRTGFAKIVAEELMVPLGRVRVELGETDRVPWDMGTFGSMSTAVDGKSLRAAAAHARWLLVDRASQQLGIPAPDLETHDGRVSARDGRSVSYEQLTAAEPLRGVVPENVAGLPATAPAATGPARLEGLDIVTGRARYAGDVRLPGMLRGHVLHPPVPGTRLTRLEDRAARALPGVVAVVREGEFAGVVAERDEQALAAVRALEAEWSVPEIAGVASTDLTLRHDEGVESAFASAAQQLSARYHVPHIAHASIGPSVAVADVREDGADLYASTQRPFGLREEAAELLGLSPDRVRVHPQMMSGLYGRGNMSDANLEAVRLSRAVKRPVLVQWTRQEEFQLSPNRPILDAELHAALDESGALAGWRYDSRTNPHTYGGAAAFPRLVEMTSGRNAVPPYRVGRADIHLHVVPGAVRTGALRSLAAAPNVFAIESFIDELAHASRQDPIEFRLRHIEDARLRRAVETVRDRSGWATRKGGGGHGLGAACAIYHGTCVAEVAEVAVAPSGQVRLERVWCALDVGRLVHPDGARNQIEGAIQQAASWTLLEELRHQDGAVITTSWRDYPIATFHDAPRAIDVVFASDPEAPSTGVGEPGAVPTSAAIANAVFAACGARVRRLPLHAAVVAAARP
jgi:CO/xanthine dehydrogenase Mo-binding subunit